MLSQKHLNGDRGEITIDKVEHVNEDAQRIITRISMRLKGVYQRKWDLLLHGEEFARSRSRQRIRTRRYKAKHSTFIFPTRAQKICALYFHQSKESIHCAMHVLYQISPANLLGGSTASYLANRLPLSIEGQVRIHIFILRIANTLSGF